MERNERYKRQTGIVSLSDFEGKKVVVIGAGGIGSWATLLIAKMGIEDITVFDFDEVEDHNVASQLFDEDMVGLNKVTALQMFVQRNVGLVVKTVPVAFNKESGSNFEYGIDTVVVVAVDSIDARKEISRVLKDKVLLGVVDGRMGGEQVEVYTYEDMYKYNEVMENFGEATPDICTERAIVYNTNLCGSLIASQIKKLCKGQPYKKNIVFSFANTALLTN